MKTVFINRQSLVFLSFTLLLACTSGKPTETHAMTDKTTCESARLKTSIAAIEKIMEDVRSNYDQAGGEISKIQLIATGVYVVSIAPEERIDQLKYEVETKADCSISIRKKDVSSITPWEAE